MTSFTDIPRRRFLQYSGLTMATLYGIPRWGQAMEKKPLAVATANFHPDVELELFARPVAFGVLPGTLTNLQKYFGKVIKGPANAFTDIPGSYLGPVMRLQKGQKVRIHFTNELDDPCITHWHGMHVPHLSDGHPMYAIAKGETWVYEFEVLNRAGTYFYHPHTHEMTGKQVYFGLSGVIIVEDEEEKKLGLPSGEFEIPIAIQDRSFDADNQLVFVTHNMERMMGFHGDRILINGKPNNEFEVASRAYRLRIANGSNARIYKLAWDDGSPITVLGVDGGLLDSPLQKPYVMMGPGERLDVWADFSGREVGAELVMRSKPFSGTLPAMHERMMAMMGHGGEAKTGENKPGQGGGGMGGMMGGMGGMGGMGHGGDAAKGGDNKPGQAMGQGGGGMGGMGGMGMMNMPGMKLPLGSDYPICKFRVTRKVSDSPKLPEKLCTIRHYEAKDTANPDKPIPIGISEGMMSMLLNGRPFKMDDVQEFEKVKVNTLQLIDIFHDHYMVDGKAKTGDTAQKPAGEQGSGMAGMSQGQPAQGGSGMGGMGMGMMGGGMGGMMNHGGEGKAPGMGSMAQGGENKPSGGGMDHGGDNKGGGMGMGMMGGGMGGMGGGGMGGMMSMSMAHPIHLHGQQFQIISRSLDMKEGDGYDTVKDGFINSGWKDVVLVMPGERVKIAKPFDNYTGLFTYHCHNLEHEDMGMMRDFLVT
ncbi:MAG: multicopper oxidase domain-containing protein [Proteobacteria bacterium]|nr:multicopper oxidase domain-containing protein [Pseudomonadota bacterium]